uniref:Uncharacterized protein n=1 Tax=Arundo donax TaxID=35708 RepID=A0A0A8ZA84_ARUDO
MRALTPSRVSLASDSSLSSLPSCSSTSTRSLAANSPAPARRRRSSCSSRIFS